MAHAPPAISSSTSYEEEKKEKENLGFWTTAPLKNTNSLWPNSSRSVC